jgi:hypothetical protein
MDHMQFLVERSSEPDGDPCGHALMASCPPEPFPEPNSEIPFGHTPIYANGGVTQKTWDLSKPDLANLLDLSKRLNLDGEITPVMAWGMILAHPRFSEMRTSDFGAICTELGGKVRCYGYVMFSSSSQCVLTGSGSEPSWKNSRFGMLLRAYSIKNRTRRCTEEFLSDFWRSSGREGRSDLSERFLP